MLRSFKRIISSVLIVLLMTTMFLGAFGIAAPEPVHAAGGGLTVIATRDSVDYTIVTNASVNDTISLTTWNSKTGKTYKEFTAATGSVAKVNASSIKINSTGSGTVTNIQHEWTVTVKQEHTHSWTDASYSASGNVITATCQGSGTCPLTKPTLTLNASGKTYDGTVVTATLSKNDTWTSQSLPTPTITYSPANSKNAGTYTASAKVGNATAQQSFTISKKQITLTGITANSKVYDGTDAADINSGSAALSGVVSGDNVQIDKVTGTFTAGKAAGNGKAISATATLKGADAGNYEPAPISLTADITPKEIKLIKAFILDKVYDGNLNANRNTNMQPIFEGLIEGDVVNIRANCKYEDRNVGTDKTVIVEGPPGKNGADAKNYIIVDSDLTYSTASITPATLTISGITVLDKEYDGNTGATVDLSNISYSGIKPPWYDEVYIDPESVQASFEDQNAGSDKAVNVTFELAGPGKDNYVGVLASPITANITPKEVTVSGITVDTKEYDKTALAPLNTASATFDGMLAGDELTVSGTGTFEDAAVGTDKDVAITGLTLGGADANNYSIAAGSQSAATGTITKRAIKVSGITAEDKLYDGNTNVTLNLGGIVLNGKLEGDDLSLKTEKISGIFESASAGAKKIVDISGYELEGNDVENYVLATIDQQTHTTANIAKKEITVSGIEAEDKIYDGSDEATMIFDNVVLEGKREEDDLFITAKGRFDDKKAEKDKPVTIYDLELTGEDAGNYVFAKTGQQNTTTATITKRYVKVEGITASDKVYDGTTAATINTKDAVFVNMVEGDNLTVSTTGEFEDKNAGENKTVILGELVFGGADLENYRFAAIEQQKTATATISKKPVQVVAKASGKNFDEEDPELEYVAGALIEGDGAEYTGNVAREEGEDAGVYEIQIGTLSAGANYEIEYTPADFTIVKAMTNEMDLTMFGWTYGDTSETPIVTVEHGEDTVIITYSDEYDGEYTADVPTDAGTYFVKAEVEETENYVGAEEIVSFTIARREVKLEWADQEIEYNGEAQKPTATVGNLVEGDECEVIVEGEQVDTNAVSGIEKYEAVAVELTGEDAKNYVLPDDATAAFLIYPKQITMDMLSVENDMLQDNGSEQGPTITLTDGQVLVQDKDYVLSGDVTSDKAGTHFITIEGIGNYRSTLETSWVCYGERDNYQKEAGEAGCGHIEIFVDIEDNTEAITINNLTVDVAKTFLTKEDLERYHAGEHVLVYVEVFEESKSAADVSEEALILRELAEIGATDIRWFDISVWKKIGNDAAKKVHEIGTAIEMTITVPSEYQNAEEGCTRTFYFDRAHAGEATILAKTTGTEVSFASDKFSTFALAYKDTKKADNTREDQGHKDGTAKRNDKLNGKLDNKLNDGTTLISGNTPKTGDEANVIGWVYLMAVSAMAIVALGKRSRENEE